MIAALFILAHAQPLPPSPTNWPLSLAVAFATWVVVTLAVRLTVPRKPR